MNTSHPDREDLALAALPAEPRDPAVVAHLAECPACRDHVATLARTVALAQEGAADVDGQAAPARVWAAIAAELGPELGGDGGTGGLPGDRATPPTGGRPARGQEPRRSGRRWRGPLVAAAAALVALVIGVGVGIGIGGGNGGGAPPPSTVVAQLRPVGAGDPAGSGTLTTVEQAGVRTMVVHLTGVTDTAGADYLEAWLMNQAGTQIVALGALTPDGDGYQGSFTVPANLPMAELDVVDISAERYDGNAGHSGVSILRGTVS